jgi:3-deoxy-D-manno-octulosonic-acid transferase
MNITSRSYRMATAFAVPLVPHLLRDAHQRAAHEARLANVEQLIAWGRNREQNRPLAWFHAPSVGEGLQAEAVIHAFQVRHPEAELIYTHYSPSAVTLAQRLPVAWAGFLPYDRRQDVARMLDALHPDLLVFTKLDLWPELATQAAARGTAVTMVAATVDPGSSRLRWPARVLTRPGYQALSMAGAIAGGDAERLVRLGCKAENIVLTGDPRIDSVLDRADSPRECFFVQTDDSPVMIAGSTWAADEAVLLQSLRTVRAAHPDAKLIIVPHEPTPPRLLEIEAAVRDLGLPAAVRLSAQPPESPISTLTLVDRVGMLAQLYHSGNFAYVGGGFGTRGIHSVLEPAAAGLPVIIGPNDRGSRDAALLDSAQALLRLPRAPAAERLTAQWLHWLDAPNEARVLGQAARDILMKERGAANRSADLLSRALRNSGGVTE